MNALKRILGHDDKFFNLLEASAAEARGSVQLLMTTMTKGDVGPTQEEFVLARRRDKKITEEISEELCKTFVTPLDREDIEHLSIALHKIPKMVEKFTKRRLICRHHLKCCLDLHDMLERIIDRCRDAGNVIFQTVLKYS